jgi:hypothetical protein
LFLTEILFFQRGLWGGVDHDIGFLNPHQMVRIFFWIESDVLQPG